MLNLVWIAVVEINHMGKCKVQPIQTLLLFPSCFLRAVNFKYHSIPYCYKI